VRWRAIVRLGDVADADVVLLNTCAIRDKAEACIWSRLRQLRAPSARKGRVTIDLLGCMAERLKCVCSSTTAPVRRCG
jgi:tRNA A37 methylthiotransferase MiaB